MEGASWSADEPTTSPRKSASASRSRSSSASRSASKSRSTSPARSAGGKKSASPVRSARRGEYFINPKTGRAAGMYVKGKDGERVLNKIYTALADDIKGDQTAGLTFYPTLEAAREAAKAENASSASARKASRATQYWVDKSKGKYEKGSGRRGRIVVLHKPKGEHEGPFASKEAAQAWAADNEYVSKASVAATKPRGPKTGRVFRLPGEKGWNQVTLQSGKENPKLTAYKAGSGGKTTGLEFSTWEAVKKESAQRSSAARAEKLKPVSDADVNAAAAAARASGKAKPGTVDAILEKWRAGVRTSAQARSDLQLIVRRPEGGARSGFCIKYMSGGKETGSPISVLDINGDVTASGFAEASKLSGSKITGGKDDQKNAKAAIRALQKAMREGKIVQASSGKKCPRKGDDGFHDLKAM